MGGKNHRKLVVYHCYTHINVYIWMLYHVVEDLFEEDSVGSLLGCQYGVSMVSVWCQYGVSMVSVKSWNLPQQKSRNINGLNGSSLCGWCVLMQPFNSKSFQVNLNWISDPL